MEHFVPPLGFSKVEVGTTTIEYEPIGCLRRPEDKNLCEDSCTCFTSCGFCYKYICIQNMERLLIHAENRITASRHVCVNCKPKYEEYLHSSDA